MATRLLFLGYVMYSSLAAYAAEPILVEEQAKPRLSSNQLAMSHLQGWAANIAALNSFDVVAVFNEFSERPDGSSEEIHRSIRLAIDPSEKSAVFVMNDRRNQISAEGVESSRVLLGACGMTNTSGWSCDGIDGSRKSFREATSERMANILQIPSLRHLGIGTFMRHYPGAVKKEFSFVDNYFSPNKQFKAGRGLEDQIRVTNTIEAGDLVVKNNWLIDAELMMPVSRVDTSMNIKVGSTQRLYEEHFDYDEFEGIFLPVEVFGNQARMFYPDEEDPDKAEVYYAQFDWKLYFVSVNEALDEKLFEAGHYSTVPKTLSFLNEGLDEANFESVDR